MIEDEHDRSVIEHNKEWWEWCDRIRPFRFDSDWDVRIIPPFGGAITRFTITKGDKHVSVYLDVFSRLGLMYDEAGDYVPYYEVYDGENTPRFLLDEVDDMMSYIRTVLN